MDMNKALMSVWLMRALSMLGLLLGLLGTDLFDQTIGFAPALHHVEHIADINTDAACQLLVEEDI